MDENKLIEIQVKKSQKNVLPIIFSIIILISFGFSDAFGQSTSPNFKVAFIGDQGLGASSEAVLTLIAGENVDMVLHSGDFDYADNPTAWDNQINTFLPGVPYFASVGNHDRAQWSGYQAVLQNRLNNIPGAVCIGDLGVKSSCYYQGLFFVLSGVGTHNGYTKSEYVTHLQTELANDNSVWSICSWHKNQNAMQVGSKSNQVGWAAYEACKDGGAIIATAHEHSYERTKSMTNTQTQTIDSAWSDPNNVRVAEGSTFVFVSGLGGKSIRNQDRCNPDDYPYGCNEWANIYTSDQNANHGALFCVFNVDGQEDKAYCYFKNISGNVVDSFHITSFMGNPNPTNPPNNPPSASNQSVNTDENVPLGLTLGATDPDGDLLAYSIESVPQNGSISGTGPYLVYTPNLNFAGNDTFNFKTNDGTVDSNIAIVSITVDPIVLPPGTVKVRINSGSDDAEETISDGSMYLTSSDIEIGNDLGNNGDQYEGLRFNGVRVPPGKTINSAYIEFVTDEIDSVSTSVVISAQDSDNAPTYSSTAFDISSRPTTTATVAWNNIPSWNAVDEKHQTPDLSALVQEVVDRPGWAEGNSMAFIIGGTGTRTAESYEGEAPSAALLHIVYDTTTNTSPVVTITAPADGSSFTIGDSISFTGTAIDTEDGNISASLSWSSNIDGVIGSGGSFSSSTLSVGIHTITASVTDSDGNPGSDSISVTVTNGSPPVAHNQSVSTFEETPIGITLTASDANGDPLTFNVLSNPANGILTGIAPNLTYTPNTSFTGNDSFTFNANDGTEDSNTATVSITVDPISEIHVGDLEISKSDKKRWTADATITVHDSLHNPISGVTVDGTWSGSSSGSDSCVTDGAGSCQTSMATKGSSLTFTVDNLTGTGLTYVGPNHVQNGNSDGTSITINSDGSIPGPNLPPTAVDDDSSTYQDEAIEIDVLSNDSDPNGDTLSVQSVTQGSLGSVTNNDSSVTYTPNPGELGSDSFTYTITDGNGETDTATVNVTITEPPPATLVHLGALDGVLTSKGPWNTVTITITVHGPSHLPQSGVLASGTWSGVFSGSDSCTTDSSGTCTVSDRTKSSGDAIFTLDDMTGSSIVYDLASNDKVPPENSVTIP